MPTQNSTNYSPTQYAIQVGSTNGSLSQISPATTLIPQPLTSAGASANPAFSAVAAYSFTMNRQVFTVSGTYTPTTNMKYAIIECVGGGGSTGNLTGTQVNTVVAHASCTGGTYSRGVFSAASVGASQTATIGAGGTSAGAGGTTSIGSLITAPGGGGLAAIASNTALIYGGTGGAPGAAGSGGSFFFQGSSSKNAIAAFVSTSALFSSGARGGSTFFGGGGAGTGTVTNGTKVAANAGVSYGGGAGGCCMGSNVAASAVGASGFQGIIIITEIIHT